MWLERFEMYPPSLGAMNKALLGLPSPSQRFLTWYIGGGSYNDIWWLWRRKNLRQSIKAVEGWVGQLSRRASFSEVSSAFGSDAHLDGRCFVVVVTMMKVVMVMLTSKELTRKAEALCGKVQQTSVGSTFKLHNTFNFLTSISTFDSTKTRTTTTFESIR